MSQNYEQVSSFLYGIVRVVLTKPLTLLFHVKIHGAENWPQHGPAIIASNHASNLDPCLVAITFPGQIRWMAKAELWKVPVLGWLITKLGAFPVRRGESDREAIRRARELMREGDIIGMFPEGTRQREGVLGEAQPGVGMLAMEPGVPVIPVRVRGDDQIMRGLKLRRSPVTVTIGPPVDLKISGMSRGRAHREASNRIMAAIAAL